MARQFLDVNSLASILCVSSKTLRNKYSDPIQCKQLPPCVVIPGIERLLWDSKDVEAWQNSLTRSYGSSQPIVIDVGNKPVPLSTEQPRRGRGRPTNMERAAALMQ